jgi:DNA-binding CsgD family transcriptional regulator
MADDVTDTLLENAAALLDLLTHDPAPADVCRAVVENRAVPVGAVGAAILFSGSSPLREAARHGAFPHGAAAAMDDSAARCLQEGRILLVDEAGRHVPTAPPRTAHIPIRSAGRTTGVLVLAFDGSKPWSIGEYRAAEGFADAIGLWAASALASAGARPAATVTDRQRQVLQLLADNHSTNEIAQELAVSRTTIKTDIRAVLVALGAADRAAAVRAATAQGLIGTVPR